MTDILSDNELNDLSTDELLNLYFVYNARAIIQKNIEQAIKILINSLYGYLGSPYSRFFNVYIAEAITLTGRAIIQTSAKAINDDLIKITGVDKDRIIAVDTDSTRYDTLIYINNKEVPIGDYYNSISDDNLVNTKKEIKRITNNDVSLSFNGTNIENKNVTYVMRHKVKKNLYKITVGDKSVTVTEDHSIIVLDDNNAMLSIKPKDINNTKHQVVKIIKSDLYDKLNFELTNDFTVECLGEVDDYVYDIEVEDNHNFFANNILVHNSNYFDLTDIVNLPKSGWANKPTNEIVDLLDKFCNVRIDKVLDETFKNLLSNLNSFDNCISMKREAIGSGVFVQKKRYTMLVYDNEGVRYTKPKLKITGLEAVRSSTPKYFRDKLKVIYEMMYYNKQDEIQEEIKNIKQEFFNLPLISIAKPAGVNGLSDYDNNSKELGFFAKGTPSGVKASLTYNRAIEQYGLKDKFHTINSGDKVKIFNLKMPNPFKNDKIAVIDKIPVEFNLDKYVDKEGLFNDSFISPLENILKVVSWSPLKMINLDDFF